MTLDDQNSNSQERNGSVHGRDQDGALANLDNEPKIDDRGTDQTEALQILTSIRDGAFDSNNETLALALGRPTQEIEDWFDGVGEIDGDALQKARALAIERDVQIE